MAGHFGTIKTKSKYLKKPTKTPSINDLAWAAGFIEGDGWVTKTKTTNQISVKQKNKEPLILLQNLFGGSIYEMRTKYKGKPYKIFQWTASGARARGIMMTLYSWMSFRRKDQFRKALSND